MRIAARSLSGQPSIIQELKVQEGDSVKRGQVLAVLDSREQLEATVRDWEARVAVAEQRLAVIKPGPRESDIAAQQAEIARLEAVLQNAKRDAGRAERLYLKGSATVTDRDRGETEVETTEQAIKAAKARLAGLSDVRATDIRLAEREVESARASVARARSELEAAYVRAPWAGRIIKIHAHNGEQVGPEGILDLGRTDKMYAMAEVYETDIARVHVGQSATVTGEALHQPLRGHVEYVGLQVAKNATDPTDPVSLSDARVVEVKVLLDDSTAAAGLLHAQVTVVIEL
jgi:HlyD family secretion protein